MLASALTVYFFPTDRLLDMLSPRARLSLVLALALIGRRVSQTVGLGDDATARPFLTGALCAAAIAVFCVGIDLAFRKLLSPAYVAMFTGPPVLGRIVVFGGRTLVQGFLYRIFLASAFIWIVTRFRRPSALVGIVCFGAAWMVNMAVNNVGFGQFSSTDPLLDLYVLCRFLLPGIGFGVVFMRFGMDANEYAASLVQVVFQPLVTAAL